MDIKEFLPKLYKRNSIDDVGRDPLGLSRLAGRLSDFLVSGISTISPRARYYSFFAWSIKHTLDNDECGEDYEKFADGMRRREAFFVLANICNANIKDIEQRSLDGVTKGKLIYEAGIKTKTYSCDYLPLPSNDRGSFGQNYAGSMYNIGMIHQPNGVEELTDNALTNGIVSSFHKSVAETPWVKEKLYKLNTIDEKTLHGSCERFSLESLSDEFAKDERLYLQKIFLAIGKDMAIIEEDLMRRETLLLITDIVKKYQLAGTPIELSQIQDSGLIPVTYYGELYLEDRGSVIYLCPQKLKNCFSYWEQFSLHYVFTYGVENLLQALLEEVGAKTSGMTLDEVVEKWLSSDELRNINVTVKEFIGSFGIDSQNVTEQAIATYVNDNMIMSATSEYSLIWQEWASNAEGVSFSLKMLFSTYVRWLQRRTDSTFTKLANSIEDELWVGTWFMDVDSALTNNLNMSELLKIIIEKYILNRHDDIMFSKHRSEGWIVREQRRILKERDYSPRTRQSRWFQASTILIDLGLINVSDDGKLTITTIGETYLKEHL